MRLVTQKLWDWITDLWSPDLPVLSLPPTPVEPLCGMGWLKPLVVGAVGLGWWPESSRAVSGIISGHGIQDPSPLPVAETETGCPGRTNAQIGQPHARSSIRYRPCFSTLKPGPGKEAMGFIPVPVCQWELFHFGVGHLGSLSVAGAQGCGLAELGWHHSSYFPGLGTGNCWA